MHKQQNHETNTQMNPLFGSILRQVLTGKLVAKGSVMSDAQESGLHMTHFETLDNERNTTPC